MNFCGNCGSNIPEGSPFCPNCGAPAQSAQAATAEKTGNGLDVKKIIIGGVAVVLVVLFCVLIFGGCSSGPEKAVDNMMEAIYKDFDKDAAVDLIHEDMSKEIGAKDSAKYLTNLWEDLKEDDEVELEWKIDKVKDVDEDDLEDIQDLYDDRYDLEVTDAKEVKVEYTIYEDGDEEEDDKLKVTVVKIDGDWYCAGIPYITYNP